MLLNESSFVMASAAENTLLVWHDKVVPCLCVETVTATTAHPPVKEANFQVIGQREVVASGFSQRYVLIVHAYRMVGHISPASGLLVGGFVFRRDCHSNLVVAAQAHTGLGIKSAHRLVQVSNGEG